MVSVNASKTSMLFFFYSFMKAFIFCCVWFIMKTSHIYSKNCGKPANIIEINYRMLIGVFSYFIHSCGCDVV